MRKECSDESKKLFSDKTKCIDENAKIETLIDQICEDDTAYPIVNAQSGELVGEIDRTIVMKSMKSK
jgi:glycine betaine/proline transport system ATP-binding protein